MINHYINLVCWRAMHSLFREERDIVWADSISMVKVLSWFGHSVEYRPGTSVVGEAIKSGDLLNEGFFLTARPLRGVPDARQLTLPIIREGDIHSLPEEVRNALASLAPGTQVAIGVSSPKQNRIAAMLFASRPDLTYHCLGAALTLIDSARDDPNALEYAGSGKEWKRFLLKTPKRTFAKLWVTFVEMFRILFLFKIREEFHEFAQVCQREKTCVSRPAQPVKSRML